MLHNDNIENGMLKYKEKKEPETGLISINTD